MIKKGRNRVPFLYTYIDSLTSNEAKYAVDDLIKADGFHYVVTPNTDIVVKMQDDLYLRNICNNADLILPDGMPIVKISKWYGHPIKERVAMTDFVWDVCDLAVEKDYRIFFLGGKEQSLKAALQNIRSKYSGIRIAGSYSPPIGFENDENKLNEINQIIRESRADILIVFLGCPKQERFIYENKESYQVPVSITMGGCVDFLAGNVKRAPKWMQNACLEWVFRFIQEPKRLFKRYFVDDMKIIRLMIHYKLNKYTLISK